MNNRSATSKAREILLAASKTVMLCSRSIFLAHKYLLWNEHKQLLSLFVIILCTCNYISSYSISFIYYYFLLLNFCLDLAMSCNIHCKTILLWFCMF